MNTPRQNVCLEINSNQILEIPTKCRYHENYNMGYLPSCIPSLRSFVKHMCRYQSAYLNMSRYDPSYLSFVKSQDNSLFILTLLEISSSYEVMITFGSYLGLTKT